MNSRTEVIKSNKLLLVTLWLIKIFPEWAVSIMINFVSFFFYVFSKNARFHIKNFLKTLDAYNCTKNPKSKSIANNFHVYKTILSFAYCIVEKMEGWLGKIKYERLITFNDDLKTVVDELNRGKGAFFIGSHLGNIELLRSLTSFNWTGCKRNISVAIIMENHSTSIFNETIRKINPAAKINVIDADSIGPDSIVKMQEIIESGGIVVVAADRLPKTSNHAPISLPFLGKNADFPYGVFLLPLLLKTTPYFMFSIRAKTPCFHSRYEMHIEKSRNDFENPVSRNERETKIVSLAKEFSVKLENYTIKNPIQWYNFFDFWKKHEN